MESNTYTRELLIPESITRDGDPVNIEMRISDSGVELDFPATSQYPVRRYWGNEILDHAPSAVRMGRVDAGAAPLLVNHNFDDPVGMVHSGRVKEDGRLWVVARLFNTARSKEVQEWISGGLRNVSAMYEIHKMEESRNGDLVVTDWEPQEVSIVTVPADPTVGIGRSSANQDDQKMKRVRVSAPKAPKAKAQSIGGPQVDDKQDAAVSESADNNVSTKVEITREEEPKFDVRKAETKRKDAIRKLSRANSISADVEDHWIRSGADWDTVAEDTLRILEERGKQADAPAMIGMSKKEVRQYSLMAAIRASYSNNWSKAGLEFEAHNALRNRDNLQQRDNNSFFVPMDVQARTPLYGRRDFNVAGAPNLVGTDHLAGSFIDLLRNTSVVMRMGATRLTGLRGNVAIPKMTSGATAFWLASETTAITESQAAIGQLTLSPKNVAGLTEISHQMMQQGDPSAEQLILSDLAQTVAIAADLGALSGDGVGGTPTGITNTVGLGTGFDPGVAAIDYTHFLGAQQDVVTANAMLGGMGYVLDPATTVKAMTRVKFTGTASPIWDGNILEGDCAGFRGMTSNQMAADTGLFGAWATAVIAEWGTLELATNPNQNFAAGITGLRAWYTMDFGMRYPEAFSFANGIT
jgi:HK97 family phage major capsid protein/HK97 family phage prohead protease